MPIFSALPQNLWVDGRIESAQLRLDRRGPSHLRPRIARNYEGDARAKAEGEGRNYQPNRLKKGFEFERGMRARQAPTRTLEIPGVGSPQGLFFTHRFCGGALKEKR